MVLLLLGGRDSQTSLVLRVADPRRVPRPPAGADNEASEAGLPRSASAEASSREELTEPASGGPARPTTTLARAVGLFPALRTPAAFVFDGCDAGFVGAVFDLVVVALFPGVAVAVLVLPPPLRVPSFADVVVVGITLSARWVLRPFPAAGVVSSRVPLFIPDRPLVRDLARVGLSVFLP